MKTLNNNKTILLTCILFLSTICAYAYPPDNAAILYYKAAMSYEVDDEMSDMLADLRKGKIELNNKIREFVNKNRLIINTLLDASEIKNCDWGMDFSQGLEMEMPQLSKMKALSRLIIADSKILAKDGHYGTAIYRCMNLYKIARHINDRNLLCYLVGIAVNNMTNNCLIQIISEMPHDMQSLTRLKNQLIEIDSIPLSVKPALLGERETMLGVMTLEQMPEVIRLCVGDDESVKQKILSFDKAAIVRNRKYFENYYAGIIAGFDMPYVESYAAMTDLSDKIEKDIGSNPDTILAIVLMPATVKIFSFKIRSETYDNAIETAIELYLVKAKTGKLPGVLPENLPVDLFSGKAFEYEKTKDGFTLRCREKEVGKDQPHEYKFKIS